MTTKEQEIAEKEASAVLSVIRRAFQTTFAVGSIRLTLRCHVLNIYQLRKKKLRHGGLVSIVFGIYGAVGFKKYPSKLFI